MSKKGPATFNNHQTCSRRSIYVSFVSNLCNVGLEQMTASRERGIRDVKEPVFVLVFFVNTAHECSCRRQDFIDEDEDGFFRRKLDTLADDVDELADCEVCRYQILLFIDGSNVRFLDLLTDNLLKRRLVSYRNKR